VFTTSTGKVLVELGQDEPGGLPIFDDVPPHVIVGLAVGALERHLKRHPNAADAALLKELKARHVLLVLGGEADG
jgi:hypothetical protein